jgi:hypothetical protein
MGTMELMAGNYAGREKLERSIALALEAGPLGGRRAGL